MDKAPLPPYSCPSLPPPHQGASFSGSLPAWLQGQAEQQGWSSGGPEAGWSCQEQVKGCRKSSSGCHRGIMIWPVEVSAVAQASVGGGGVRRAEGHFIWLK